MVLLLTGGTQSRQNRFFQNKTSPSFVLQRVRPSRMTGLPNPNNVGGHPPGDIPIHDNYVEYALSSQHGPPPVTWTNWYKELDWFNFIVLSITPVIGIVGAMSTPLQWRTFMFAVFYLNFTGLGVYFCPPSYRTSASDSFPRYHVWLPSLLGPPRLQCIKAFAIRSRAGRCWCGSPFYQMVVDSPPRSSPIFGHRPRSLHGRSGVILESYRLDDIQTSQKIRSRGCSRSRQR